MNFENDFKDKVVVVTGASGGLGKETAVQFAKAGATVVIGDLKKELGDKAVAQISEACGTQAFFFPLDVTDAANVKVFFEKTVEKCGRVDILVNSAGISGDGFKPYYKIDMGQWDAAYSVNVKGLVNCCREVTPIFQSQKHGKIVNVASVSGRKPTPGLMHYAASKAAVVNLSQSMAHEMARFNVNVNVVCPGWIWTPIYGENPAIVEAAEKQGKNSREFFLDMVKHFCCLRREQTAEDIAAAVLFFASEAAKNITGQSLNVDGGAVMS